MGFTPHDFDMMQMRLKRVLSRAVPPSEASERETGPTGLHRRIADYCKNQFPEWKVIAARTDTASTIATGCHDMTIFLPGGKLLLLELKSKTGKVSQQQTVWNFQLDKLGFKVHVVRSMEEFLTLSKS